jgi:hypothetical protein
VSTTPSARSIVTFVALAVAPLLAFLLLIFLSGKPYVIQLASIIGDTFWVFCMVSFDSSFGRGYDLNRREFKSKMPLILSVHCSFLVLLVALEMLALQVEPSLRPSWRAETGLPRMSDFDYFLVYGGACRPSRPDSVRCSEFN